MKNERYLVHEAGIVVLGEVRRGLRNRRKHRHQPILVGLGEIAEDMAADPMLLAGMPDADAYAAIVGPDRRRDRAGTVVAGISAARLHLELAGGERDLVMDHHHRGQWQLEERDGGADRAAALVHERRGLDEIGLAAAEFAFADHRVKARAPRSE